MKQTEEPGTNNSIDDNTVCIKCSNLYATETNNNGEVRAEIKFPGNHTNLSYL